MEINMKDKKVREWRQFYRLKFKMKDGVEVSSVSARGGGGRGEGDFPGSLHPANRDHCLPSRTHIKTEAHPYFVKQASIVHPLRARCPEARPGSSDTKGAQLSTQRHWVWLFTAFTTKPKLTFMSTFTFERTVSSELKFNLVFYH